MIATMRPSHVHSTAHSVHSRQARATHLRKCCRCSIPIDTIKNEQLAASRNPCGISVSGKKASAAKKAAQGSTAERSLCPQRQAFFYSGLITCPSQSLMRCRLRNRRMAAQSPRKAKEPSSPLTRLRPLRSRRPVPRETSPHPRRMHPRCFSPNRLLPPR